MGSKTLLLFLSSFLFLLIPNQLLAQDNFYLHENGVTVMCPDAEVGETGVVDGVEYEAVDRDLLNHRKNDEADLSKVCTSHIVELNWLFLAPDFDQDIGNWDVSNVNYMNGTFAYASSFNQDIGDWDVSNVDRMSSMFKDASNFNQDIGRWDISNVTNMEWMFKNASNFNQDLSGWCVTNIQEEPDNFSYDSPLSEENKPIWGTCPDNNNSIEIGWVNLQWPGFGAIDNEGSFDIYSQIYIDGLTGDEVDNPNINAWIGISTEDTDPSAWSEDAWIPATFNTSVGNNDEYFITLQNMEPGIYYYASRFRYANSEYAYGGFSGSGGNFWDEGNFVSGILVVAEDHQEIVRIDPDNPEPVYAENNYSGDTPVAVLGTYSFWEEQFGYGADAYFLYDIPEGNPSAGEEPIATNQDAGLIINNSFLKPFNPTYNSSHVYVYTIPDELIDEEQGNLHFVINDYFEGIPSYGDNSGELIAITNFSFGQEGLYAVTVKDAHSNPKENVELHVYPQNNSGPVFSEHTNEFGVALFDELSIGTPYVVEAYNETPVIEGESEFWGSLINQSTSSTMPIGEVLERSMVYANSVYTTNVVGDHQDTFLENQTVYVNVSLKNPSHFDQEAQVELHLSSDTLQSPIQTWESDLYHIPANSSQEVSFSYQTDTPGEYYIRPYKTKVKRGDNLLLSDTWFWVDGFEVIESGDITISNVIPQSPVTLSPGDTFEYEIFIKDSNQNPVEGVAVEVYDELNNQSFTTSSSNSDGIIYHELQVPVIITEGSYEISFILNGSEIIRTVNIDTSLHYDALIITVDGIAGTYGVICGEVGDLFETCRTRETNYLESAVNSLGLEDNIHVEAHQWNGFTATSREEIDNIKELILDRYEYTNNNDAKLIAIGHSWGTFLTYVALGELADMVEIDLYILLSSPFGTEFRPLFDFYGDPLFDIPAKVGIMNKVNSILSEIDVSLDQLSINAERVINWWVRGDLISGPINQINSSFEDKYINFADPIIPFAYQTMFPLGESYHDYTKLKSGLHSDYLRNEVKKNILSTLIEADYERPIPNLSSYEISADTVNIGESIEINLEAENLGGNSEYASITVSFPNLNDPSDANLIQILEETSNSEYVNIYPKGDTIHNVEGDEFEAEYLMVEYGEIGWESGSGRTLALNVSPRSAGNFEINFRTNMQESNTGAYFNYPSESQDVDQQNWPVISYNAYVDNITDQPQTVTLLSPQDGAADIEVNPTLHWQEADNALTYHVQLSLTQEFGPPDLVADSSGIEGTEFLVTEDLESTTEYFWRVNATNEGGTGEWSEVWSFITEMATSIAEDEIPAEFTLNQNYPNPFNPTTIIQFGLPEAGTVQLTVYNMLGQRVAILTNEHKTAGWHEVTLDASGLSSGMYIYRLQAGSEVQVRKMMLIK